MFDGFLTRLPTRARTTNGSRRRRGRQRASCRDVAKDEAPRAPRRHRPSSISPSRRRAIPRPAWSRSWRSSASAGPRPMPDHAGAAGPRLCAARQAALHPGGPRPLVTAFLQTSSSATSSTTSPPISRTSSTTSPAARSTGSRCCATSGRTSPPRSARPRTCTSARCSTRSTRSWPAFLPGNDDGGNDPRVCPSCANGRLGLKLGKFGAFIGCSNYPECRYTRQLGIVDPEADAAWAPTSTGRSVLGIDPATGKAGHPAQRPLRPLRPARRGRGQGEAQARSRCPRA